MHSSINQQWSVKKRPSLNIYLAIVTNKRHIKLPASSSIHEKMDQKLLGFKCKNIFEFKVQPKFYIIHHPQYFSIVIVRLELLYLHTRIHNIYLKQGTGVMSQPASSIIITLNTL